MVKSVKIAKNIQRSNCATIAKCLNPADIHHWFPKCLFLCKDWYCHKSKKCFFKKNADFPFISIIRCAPIAKCLKWIQNIFVRLFSISLKGYFRKGIALHVDNYFKEEMSTPPKASFNFNFIFHRLNWPYFLSLDIGTVLVCALAHYSCSRNFVQATCSRSGTALVSLTIHLEIRSSLYHSFSMS